MLGGDWTDGTMTDFKWRHFQGDVILWAVRWYCRYPISYRDLGEMLAERGISVDHTTIYRWVQCYAPEMEKRLRWFWRRGFYPSWRLDEKIGRASCRERVCQDVSILVVAVSLKKKKEHFKTQEQE